jgi:hypothetical protein
VVICPNCKNSNKIDCNNNNNNNKNNREISLPNTTYKKIAKILSERFKPYVEVLEEYQNGFWRKR